MSAAKPNQTLTLCWVLAGYLALAVSGCAVGAEHETAAGDEADNLESLVDAQVLENIRTLENGLVGPAMQHEGRIWYSPDLVTTFLTTKDGSGMAFTLGDARDYAALDSPPAVGATGPLADVLAQQAVEPTHVFASESGLDIVLFDAPPQTSGIGQATEALAGPQSCPTTFFPQTCNPTNQLQYANSTMLTPVIESDRTIGFSPVPTANIESSTIAVCSEVGTQVLRVTTSNPRWGTVPGGTGVGGLNIAQGHIGVWANFGTWREKRFCARHVFGICIDYDYNIEFQDFDVTYTITPLHLTSEFSHCANFYRTADYVSEQPCDNIFCPVVRPGG